MQKRDTESHVSQPANDDDDQTTPNNTTSPRSNRHIHAKIPVAVRLAATIMATRGVNKWINYFDIGVIALSPYCQAQA